MRAPAVLISAAGEFGAAAQLRPVGEPSGVIGSFSVAHGRENVAPADLIPKEMRRTRHHPRIVGLFRIPINAREMKSADSTGLMATRTADVVEPTLEAGQRADVLQPRAALGQLL